LQEGMQYFNTTDSVLYIWNGTAWQSSAFNEFTNFTATGSLSSENLVNRFEDIDKVKDFPSYSFLATGSVTPENLQDRFENIDKVKDFPSYNFLATGTTTPRNLVTRMADVVNVKDFGAVGDGVTDDTAEIQNAVAYWNGLTVKKALYFPSGIYKSSTAISISPSSDGQVIFGDGNASVLFNIQILIQKESCQVFDLTLDGDITTQDGFVMKSNGTNTVRDGSFYNLHIKNKQNGIVLGGATDGVSPNNLYTAHMSFVNCYIDNNLQNGLLVEYNLGVQFSNCHFKENAQNGARINQGQEVKMSNCTISENGNQGLYINGTASRKSLECYFDQCSMSSNQSNTSNRDTFTIASVSNSSISPGAKITLTIGSHTLTEGMQNIVIQGTTSYDGTYSVSNVTNTTVDIIKIFVANETGTLVRPRWDMYINGDVSGDVNDLFFTGCNVNFTYIKNAYNVNFTGTRLKEQCFLAGGCNRIMRTTTGRGRQQNAFQDINISGQTSGFIEIISSDQTATTPSDGSLGLVIRMPDSSGSLTANIPSAYNSLYIDSTDGFKFNSAYSGKYNGTIPIGGVFSFTPPKDGGFMIVTDGGGSNQRIAQVVFNCTANSVNDAGFIGSMMNAVATSSSVPNSSSGVDTKINIAAYNGLIYIINRTTGARPIYYTIFR
jgi:hypothetical protein